MAAENEKKLTDCGGIAVHGVIREIGYFFLSISSISHSLKNEEMSMNIGAWLDGALQTPSAGTLTRAWGSLVCTKKKKRFTAT